MNGEQPPTDPGPRVDDAIDEAAAGAPLEDEAAEAEALVGAVRRLLDAAAEPPAKGGEVGLFELVEAFTALRHDVKLQAKGVRSLSETSEKAAGSVEAVAGRLERIADRLGPAGEERERAERLARPLALVLAELHEAVERLGAELARARARVVERGADELAGRIAGAVAGRRSGWRRWLAGGAERDRQRVRAACAAELDETLGPLLDGIAEGHRLMRNRLASALEQQGIHRTETVGRPVDPETMRVVEAVAASGAEPGTVVEELRPGYRWDGKVLQTAEVRAARE